MANLSKDYIRTRLETIDEFLELALQEPRKAFSLQRVRQARQAISGLKTEIAHIPKRKVKNEKET